MTDDDADVNKQFRRIADAFIHLANQHCEAVNRENVGMAMLYAAARFSSFVVAANASDLKQYDTDRDAAVQFFVGEYRRMLHENLDDYKKMFDPNAKYTHLIKNDPSS